MDSVISMKTRRPIDEQEAKVAAEAQPNKFDLTAEQLEIISVLNEVALCVANGTLGCVTMIAMNPDNKAVFTYSSIPVSGCAVNDCFTMAGVLDSMKGDVLDLARSASTSHTPENFSAALADPAVDPDGVA